MLQLLIKMIEFKTQRWAGLTKHGQEMNLFVLLRCYKRSWAVRRLISLYSGRSGMRKEGGKEGERMIGGESGSM